MNIARHPVTGNGTAQPYYLKKRYSLTKVQIERYIYLHKKYIFEKLNKTCIF